MNDEIVVGDLPDCSTKEMEEALNGKCFIILTNKQAERLKSHEKRPDN